MARVGAKVPGYGVLCVIGFILSLVALFTPGWRSYKGTGAPDLGLVSRNCGSGDRQVNSQDCARWAKHLMPFEKTTLAFMILACIFEFFCVGFFFALFKTRSSAGKPAFTCCFLSFVCLFISLIVYGVNMQSKTVYMQSSTYQLLANVYLGYSYWITLVSTFIMLIATGISGGFIGNQAE